MTEGAWLRNTVGEDRLSRNSAEANRRRLQTALGSLYQSQNAFEFPPINAPAKPIPATGDKELLFVSRALELQLFDAIQSEMPTDNLRQAAEELFQISRTLTWPEDQLDAAIWLVRLGCTAVLGDRSPDFHRILVGRKLPDLPVDSDNWGIRVWSSVLEMWLRLLRKNGWEDLDAVQDRVAAMRMDQRSIEPVFLKEAEAREDVRPAWELMAHYHLAKSAEILGCYVSQGSVDGHFDIRQQLEAQFDRAIAASVRGQLVDQEILARLLARAADVMVDNSIWTATRAVNSRVTKFVQSLTDRNRTRPIFELLPPQRHTLRDHGLLGSGHRSVVVSLPTSSGKTFIAEFRMLQALNQFEHERGWVACLAPTRALVNQLTARLRHDFSKLGIAVEKISPALEIDGLEAGMLTEKTKEQQFRILVSTPEKLDLMLRGGWERKIGRPLTLIVVDEAHGLASPSRGIKLELLLATINRECRNAQFLLLTPFIKNCEEIARWLSPDSSKGIELGLDWAPNDRAVGIVRAEKGSGNGQFSLSLETRHTTRNTLDVPDQIMIGESRPLGLSWSKVKNSPPKIAAAAAQVLQKRGTVILLTDSPSSTWDIANLFKGEANRRTSADRDLKHIKQFLIDEMGPDYPLASLLEYGVGVHHAGMSEDARSLVEWLTEQGRLGVLVATTTIAQGVNFPVSGVVFASKQYRMRNDPFRIDMPPEDFWNIAGRAGRVDQEDLGIVALAAPDDKKQQELEQYISAAVGELNSTLIEMVRAAVEKDSLSNLEKLSHQPGWSAFLQYLAHSYRQIGNHEQFAAQVEQVLRGTLGFQSLRKSHQGWAESLVRGVRTYAERIKGKPLALVDATGFSWESVNATLARLGEERLPADVWSPDLFADRRDDLRRMLGILLKVPELREPLQEVTGGAGQDGDQLARIVCDWVQGRPLAEMAEEHFRNADEIDPVKAMTSCCRNVFGRLTQTASWGLAALQSLTADNNLQDLSPDELRSFRNLPARVYYGVNSDPAVALRLLGVPRSAAPSLAESLAVNASAPLHQIRGKIREADSSRWINALGERGSSHRRVWSILEGEY